MSLSLRFSVLDSHHGELVHLRLSQPILQRETTFVTTCLLPPKLRPFQNGVFCGSKFFLLRVNRNREEKMKEHSCFP